jgi:hypothetical protein
MNNTQIKLDLLCSKDKYRPNLQNIYFDPSGYAVATDGHILAAVPFAKLQEIYNADFSPLGGRYLSPDVWKQLNKKNNLVYSITPEAVELTSGTYKTINPDQVGTFVNWQNILPSINTDKITAPGLFGINCKLAQTLQDCFGAQHLAFFNTSSNEISNKAFVCSFDGCLGLLMPVMIQIEEYTGATIETIEAIKTAKMMQGVTI